MVISCDIAMDLVELYTCGAASDGTAQAVKAHLKTCPECRRFYDGYKKSSEVDMNQSPKLAIGVDVPEDKIAESVKTLSKRLRKKRVFSNIINAGVLVSSAALLIITTVAMIKDND